MIKRKEAFLLAEQTVKIVIALIVIGFLIFLLTSLYFSKVKSEELKEANIILLNSTGSLKNKITTLKVGESTKFVLLNPDGWYFSTFFNIIEKVPNKCGGQDCVCVCDGYSVENCEENGACLIYKLYFSDYEPQLNFNVKISSSDKPTLNITRISENMIKIEQQIK